MTDTKAATVGSAQDKGACSPSGMKVLDLQVGGHRYGKNGKKIGMLDRGNGVVLKALQAPPRGTRELALYKSVFSPTCTDTDLLQLREFLPHFYGTDQVDGATCLVMKNLAYDFVCPNILDLKMGRVTYDPEATPEKREHEKSKYPPLQDLGFQITGMMMHDPVSGRAEAFDKSYCRSLTADTMLTGGLGKFFGLQYGRLRKDVLSALLSRLRQIQKWFLQQKKLAFYASSLLIVYGSLQSQDSRTDQAQNSRTDQGQGRLSQDGMIDQDSRTDQGQGRLSHDGMKDQDSRTDQGQGRLSQDGMIDQDSRTDQGQGRLSQNGIIDQDSRTGQGQGRLSQDGMKDQDSQTDQGTVCLQGKRRLAEEGCGFGQGWQADMSSSPSVSAVSFRGQQGPACTTARQESQSLRDVVLAPEQVQNSAPAASRLTQSGCRAGGSTVGASTIEGPSSKYPRTQGQSDSHSSTCPMSENRTASENRTDTAGLTNKDRTDTTSPTNKDRTDTTSLTNKDRTDTTSLTNKDRKDTTSLTNKDRTDTTSLTNKDRTDTTSLTNKDRTDTTSPTNKDRTDTTGLKNEDRTDTTCSSERTACVEFTSVDRNTTCSSERMACVESTSVDRNVALVEVRMIDFAHVFPSSARDDNYLFGLQRLISFLEMLLKR